MVSGCTNELGRESSSVAAQITARWTPASAHLSVILKNTIMSLLWSLFRKLLSSTWTFATFPLQLQDLEETDVQFLHYRFYQILVMAEISWDLCQHHTHDLLDQRQLQPSLGPFGLLSAPEQRALVWLEAQHLMLLSTWSNAHWRWINARLPPTLVFLVLLG